ncbi:MAG: tetratricopeptide repeat protein, partial [Anaerolineales bacterium]
MPLFFDHRYLEMSYLSLSLSKIAFEKVIELVSMMADPDRPNRKEAPIEMSGVSGVITAARNTFSAWLTEAHPSLQDDLWGQYWLAGVAAGLSYTHKIGLPDAHRLAGLIFAAVNLKRFLSTYNLNLPREVVSLYDQNQSAEISQVQLAESSIHNLPVQTTPFIGRKSEISAIKNFLQDPDIRLIALIGAGGTGKTRLSLQITQELLDYFRNGIFFVMLADDTEENQMISRIAKRLNVREGGRPLLESVKDYLSDKQTLLILDNFEQLVSCAPILGDILRSAPEVKILVTSRIALNLHEEQRFPVPPLQLPKKEDQQEIEALNDNESVKLFIMRAQAKLPSFTLSEDNANAIAEICRHLDGLPLAIELAAARTNLLTPQAILLRLNNRLKLLTNGGQDLPKRHRTLRNALEWSYDLLSQEEKALFTRLGVFSGGFTIEAVEKVCNLNGHLDIIENLSALVDNSLIYQVREIDGNSRFKMLETIREFAIERINAEGEFEKYQELHARFFGEVVTDHVSQEIYSAKALYWLNWAENELDNIRAALSWSLEPSGDIQLGIEVVFSLIWFWYRRGYLVEGMKWAERMLESPAVKQPSPQRAFALHSAGLLAIWKGEQEKGLVKLEECLLLLQKSEEDPWIAPAMMSNAVALLNMGRDRSARPLLEKARKIFNESNNVYFLTITLVHLGNVELGLGNPEKARRILEEALSLATQISENWILSFVKNNLGEVARVLGEYDQARSYYEECMLLLENTGDRGDMARFVHSLAYLDQHEGRLDKAAIQFKKGLLMFRRLGNRRGIAECLAGLAGLRAKQGNPQKGARMLAAAERLLQSTGGAWWPA